MPPLIQRPSFIRKLRRETSFCLFTEILQSLVPDSKGQGWPGNCGRCATSQATTSDTSWSVMGRPGKLPRQSGAPYGLALPRSPSCAAPGHSPEPGTIRQQSSQPCYLPCRRDRGRRHRRSGKHRPRAPRRRERRLVRRWAGASQRVWLRPTGSALPYQDIDLPSVNMPPALRANAGIGVPGTPLAVTWRKVASLTSAR